MSLFQRPGTKAQPLLANSQGAAHPHLTLKSLVDLLHLGSLVGRALDFLQRWEVVVIAESLVIVVDAEAELDHAVDAAGELGGLVQVKAGGEERGVEQQPDEILDGLVGLVSGRLLLQLRHDGVLGVHLHGLLGDHVGSHGVVAEGLRFHNSLHVRRPAILGGGQHARGVSHSRANDDFLHLVSQQKT